MEPPGYGELIMKKRLGHILIAFDQLLWVFMTLGAGYPDETISAASWRMEQEGKLAGRKLRPVIDWLASSWGSDHCQKAFIGEQLRKQLPPEYFEFDRS